LKGVAYVASRVGDHSGLFRKLVESLLLSGWIVKIPVPLERMEKIVSANGWVRTREHNAFFHEDIDVWWMSPQRWRYLRHVNNIPTEAEDVVRSTPAGDLRLSGKDHAGGRSDTDAARNHYGL
jgi:hypothetical protein